ncbi:MAG: alpha/beta fold hydrolase [Gemmatimonadota bacterium]|nr:alpha/beta fold hydrolase [Gemmatimonadota bacterium]MDQ8147628.1 alpha/beta fold hydrolase [Gemmatimonadota bacterium]MDQ8149253.1 alpha/beta fold hydrolase [Gemmatimonadota bacterium]MDQ8157441.1 alpha/beta fold hydrolase [Gemmatimonadota bacterium]MDQ8176856.1 alpha/beta fold hydrolase [Gemmatimonadota bacterium]
MTRHPFLTATLVLVAGVGIVVAAFWAPDRPLETLTSQWAPPPSTFRTIDGVATHLRDEGPRDDATPILLLHGTSASLHTWEGWVDSLRPTRRVITLDLPGFGLSGRTSGDDYSVARMSRFLRAALDTLGVRRAIVGGNSLGGGLAWGFAVADTARVAGLILVDAVGYPSQATSVPIGFRLARTPGVRRLVSRLLPRGVIESSLRNVYGDPSRVTPALVDRYYAMAVREGNRDALLARFRGVGSRGDTLALRALRTPTLILWGERDRLIPPGDAARFARDIAGSRVVRFAALGHVPHEEDPTATVIPVLAFVRALP